MSAYLADKGFEMATLLLLLVWFYRDQVSGAERARIAGTIRQAIAGGAVLVLARFVRDFMAGWRDAREEATR
jgi:hypothetical protein